MAGLKLDEVDYSFRLTELGVSGNAKIFSQLSRLNAARRVCVRKSTFVQQNIGPVDYDLYMC